MSWGVGHGCGLDLPLLWLWFRSAAISPIQPLAWRPPYAIGVALKRPKEKKKTHRNLKSKLTSKTTNISVFMSLYIGSALGQSFCVYPDHLQLYLSLPLLLFPGLQISQSWKVWVFLGLYWESILPWAFLWLSKFPSIHGTFELPNFPKKFSPQSFFSVI